MVTLLQFFEQLTALRGKVPQNVYNLLRRTAVDRTQQHMKLGAAEQPLDFSDLSTRLQQETRIS